jgi:hypothetical protein
LIHLILTCSTYRQTWKFLLTSKLDTPIHITCRIIKIIQSVANDRPNKRYPVVLYPGKIRVGTAGRKNLFACHVSNGHAKCDQLGSNNWQWCHFWHYTLQLLASWVNM